MKSYAVLNKQGLLLAEAVTLAEALSAADRYDGHVYNRKTGATQCQACRRFTCQCR